MDIDVSRNILREIKKRDLSYGKLSEKTGLSKSVLQRYATGQTQKIPIDAVEKIAQALNIQPAALLGWNGENIDVFSIPGISPVKTKKVPLLGGITCGEPTYADEQHGAYVEIDCAIKADFCLRANGDSMINARIYDGDMVFVRRQPDVEDGEIAAVLVDDEATLKRVYKMPGRVQLRAENPSFETLNYTAEDFCDIKILGKAIAFQSNVK